MTHDPLCPHDTLTMALAGHNVPVCLCPMIAEVRHDTLDKAIASIQPIWERGKVLDDAVFADGWLTCFESCESALETMRDKP